MSFCYKVTTTDETFSFLPFPRNIWGIYNEDSYSYFAKDLHSPDECLKILKQCYGDENVIRIKN